MPRTGAARVGARPQLALRIFISKINWLMPFVLGACSSRTAPPPAPAPAPAHPAVLTAVIEQAAVNSVLGSDGPPAAVVVLGLDGPTRVLALGHRAGIEPASYLARPGSTVKPLVAGVAAEAGVYHAGDGVTCRGEYSPEQPFHCVESFRSGWGTVPSR